MGPQAVNSVGWVSTLILVPVHALLVMLGSMVPTRVKVVENAHEEHLGSRAGPHPVSNARHVLTVCTGIIANCKFPCARIYLAESMGRGGRMTMKNPTRGGASIRDTVRIISFMILMRFPTHIRNTNMVIIYVPATAQQIGQRALQINIVVLVVEVWQKRRPSKTIAACARHVLRAMIPTRFAWDA